MAARVAILGISAFYHDSSAAILVDGELIAAAQEERFTRIKHDSSFPENSVTYVLREAGISSDELSAVVFYDKPLLKFERLVETYHGYAPKGLGSFINAMPVWIREKLFMKDMLRKKLGNLNKKIPILFPEHHFSHAASAFYPSPFEKAAILTIDGVGEWATTTIGIGDGKNIKILKELHFPHSVGLLYSAFTYYLGFTVNSGEYKLMGLAPYGNPDSEQTLGFIEIIKTHLVDIREDASILLNMKHFSFATGFYMCNNKSWTQLFKIPPRKPESEIQQEHMNLALAIQRVTEEIVFRLAATTKKLTDCEYLCMAGGVALNSVANGKLLKEGLFKDIWIQPAAGDAGGALGAAYIGWHIWKDKERTVAGNRDQMRGAFLGPEYSDKEIIAMARRYDAPYSSYVDFGALCTEVAGRIADGQVIGWFQGRMEFGPRALGNRSILGDARNPEMQKKLNLKIKFREGFRPFAPSVLEEDIEEYFEISEPSPYMLHVIPVRASWLSPLPDNFNDMKLLDRLYISRSDLPAITHVDNSARIQTVSRETNFRYWSLINEFKRQTGYGVIVNTSFNVRGEPIVNTPDQAYRCFMRTEMDALVVGNYLFDKKDQAIVTETREWGEVFKPD